MRPSVPFPSFTEIPLHEIINISEDPKASRIAIAMSSALTCITSEGAVPIAVTAGLPPGSGTRGEQNASSEFSKDWFNLFP